MGTNIRSNVGTKLRSKVSLDLEVGVSLRLVIGVVFWFKSQIINKMEGLGCCFKVAPRSKVGTTSKNGSRVLYIELRMDTCLVLF